MLVLILKFLISQSTNLESTIDIAFKNQLQVFKKLCNTVMYCTDPIGRLVNPFLTALLSSMSCPYFRYISVNSSSDVYIRSALCKDQHKTSETVTVYSVTAPCICRNMYIVHVHCRMCIVHNRIR